jgi:hypothetical protein
MGKNAPGMLLANLLISSDFSSIPAFTCHEVIVLFLKLQAALLELAKIVSPLEFYKKVEKSLKKVFPRFGVSFWVHLPGFGKIYRYSKGTMMRRARSSRETVRLSHDCEFVVADGDYFAVLMIHSKRVDINDIDFALLQYFARVIESQFSRLISSQSSIKNLLPSILNLVDACHSEDIIAEVPKLRSIIGCRELSGLLVGCDGSTTRIFGEENQDDKFVDAVSLGTSYMTPTLMAWPVFSDRRELVFVLIARDGEGFTHQHELIGTILAPTIHRMIQNIRWRSRNQDRLQLFEQVPEIARGLSVIHQRDHGISSFITIGYKLLHCEYAAVYLRCRNTPHVLVCAVAVGFADRSSIDVSKSELGGRLCGNTAMIVRRKVRISRHVIAREFITSPIVGPSKEIIGFILFINKVMFTEDDLVIARFVSSLCSLAMGYEGDKNSASEIKDTGEVVILHSRSGESSCIDQGCEIVGVSDGLT